MVKLGVGRGTTDLEREGNEMIPTTCKQGQRLIVTILQPDEKSIKS